MTREKEFYRLVVKAETQFMKSAMLGHLEKLCGPGANTDAVMDWTDTITHEISDRFQGEFGNHALAYYSKQRITYSKDWLTSLERCSNEMWEKLVYDIILHEMAHLFLWKFLNKYRGHGYAWRTMGWILGFAPIGSTRRAKRLSWIHQIQHHKEQKTFQWRQVVGETVRLSVERIA